MQLGTKIPEKIVDVLGLINTSDLYELINDGINKYNDYNTVQGVSNDMIGDKNFLTMVDSSNKATTGSKLGKTKPVVVHKNNHGNTELVNTELKSNNILGAHIVEEKERWFYRWADTYDECNNYYYKPTEENESGSLYTFTGKAAF